jgi:hypothetical protein
MKKLLLLLLLVTFCDSCTKKNGPAYPPPLNVGSGTALIFDCEDDDGNQIFNDSLSSFFQQHSEYRFAGMWACEHDTTSKPTKMLVIAVYIGTDQSPPSLGQIPQPATVYPTTLPTVGPNGEINYPK